MARAKQTGRAEARRRYRKTVSPAEAETEGDAIESGDERATGGPARASQQRASADSRPAPARPGFVGAFRAAYHPANFREDIRTLPTTLRSLAFLAAVLMVIAGGIVWYAFPVYSGSVTAWELLVLPGSALAPQLVAGFFAPRASYLLGFGVGVIQPIVYLVVNSSERVQAAYQARGVELSGQVTLEEVALAFFNSIVMGSLFAAMAAWYRRFLALSSSRRAAAGRSSSGRGSSGSSKSSPPRRTASR